MKSIIAKEVLDRFSSFTFATLVVMSSILFGLNALFFSQWYHASMDEYARKAFDREKLASTTNTIAYVRPGIYSFLAEAGTVLAPARFWIGPGGRPNPETNDSDNWHLPDVPEADWTFLVKFVFGLYAILLSYNAVSGEREEGTIQLMLSNPIRRLDVLAGKYLAMLLVLLVALIAGMATGLVVLGYLIPGIFSLDLAGKVALFMIVSCLYLSAIILMGMCGTVFLRPSSLGLLVSLFIWVVFVVAIPNISEVVAGTLGNVPREHSIAAAYDEVTARAFDEDTRSIGAGIEKGEITSEAEAQQRFELLSNRRRRELLQVYESYDRAVEAQRELTGWIARCSPTALFQFAVEGIGCTGVFRDRHLMRDLRDYMATYDAYVLKKVGRIVSTADMTLFLSGWQIGGKVISIHSEIAEEYHGDKSDFPLFLQHEPSPWEGMQDALNDTLGLVVWNIALALCSIWAISRYDIR